ncbi:WS/DGAT/MGAT family O-acyltransferase [Pseudonocardia spinosispora]|uniref:WS/DGAT/MGAT family O-acyltransferase n=1 Tax=Pseudonocardia spinosispora TaxID=103441 RepID=UPI0003FAA50C|nr:wax ester/triacylglycerol synthase family O-acyltransferase [Pseudonocardia spinosispora]
MGLVPIADSLYLWAETPRSPAHVVALQVFQPPKEPPRNLIDDLHRSMTDQTTLKQAFRRRPYRSPGTGGQYAWAIDDDIDLTKHVSRVELDGGDVEQLWEHVADFHSSPLPRDRPLWQAHLVEGLKGGRFALCTKMHHASFDGVNMGRHVLGGLSPDPTARTGTAPWMRPTQSGTRRARADRPGILSTLRESVTVAGQIAGTAGALAENAVDSVRGAGAPLPYSAPHTILNERVGTARTATGRSWPVARLRAIAKRTDTTLNDVALALCGGALRSYLLAQDALPAAPLIAMVPVSLTSTDPRDKAREGNSWAAALCNLRTDHSSGPRRLHDISDSMRRTKRFLSRLDPVSAAAVSATVLSGAALNALPGVPLPPRPPFNLVISNIPALSTTLYLNGAELTDAYPVSVVTDGQALNITLVSYAGRLSFGLTGCPRAVPNLKSLADHLADALTELERA